MHVYDAATNTWTQKKDLPYANSHLEPGTFALDGKILVVGGEWSGRNVLRYDPATDAWTVFDQVPVALIGPSAKVIDNTFVVSHGGAPAAENPQSTTWAKTITRSKSNVLGFWANQLSATAPAGGSPVTKKMLLWTLTGTTPYTLNAADAPVWLTVQAGPGTTDETGAAVTLTFDPAGLSPGTYQHTLTAAATGYTNASAVLSFTVQDPTNPAPVDTQVLARINAGGPAVTTNGIAWRASQYFTGGNPTATPT